MKTEIILYYLTLEVAHDTNIVYRFYEKAKVFSLLFIFTIMGVVFANCSSDDDDNSSSNTESIKGFWLRYDNNDQELEQLGFFSDGTCNYTYAYDPDDETEEPEYEFAKGTYSIEGDKLTMKFTFNDEKETWVYTIRSLKSKKSLVLVDEDGYAYTYEYYKE